MTSTEVKSSRSVWGSLIKTYPQSLSYNTCDFPGGNVLPLTWYRLGTGARNACMDLEVGQRSVWKNLKNFYQERLFLQQCLLKCTSKRIHRYDKKNMRVVKIYTTKDKFCINFSDCHITAGSQYQYSPT